MEGIIRCQSFQCPLGTYCQDLEDGTNNCANISKGEGGTGMLMTKGLGGRARRLVPQAFEIRDRGEILGPYNPSGPFSALSLLSMVSIP